MMNKRTMALFAAVLSLSARVSLATGPTVWDDFDGYGVGQTFISPTNGWQASSTIVVVTNDVSQSLPNSVLVPRQAALTNTVSGGSDKVIWTDCYVKPHPGDLPSDLPLDEASFVAYFNPSGFVQVATASGWVTCSNDVWGGAMTPATSGFARVSIYQNYSASNAALLVNGRLVMQDMRFVGSSSTYNTFSVMSPSSNAWLDNVWINTNYDTVTLTNDFNSNGMTEAAELASYGYVARTLYVGSGSGYPRFDDFTGALTNSRSRDTVYVFSGTYGEDVVVTNSITFSGSSFTNIGVLTVKTGASSEFINAMAWDTVMAESNSVVSFGAALACSNFTVQVGSTATVQALDSVLVDLGTNSTATFNQAVTCTTLVVRAGSTVTMASLTCSNLVVEPGAHFTCLGAFQCDSTCSIGTGAVATFSGSVTCAGAFTVAGGATVNLGQGATLVSLDAIGAVVVGAGKTLTVSGAATVSGGVQVSGSGVIVVNGTLSVTGSGLLTFTNSQLNVTSSSVTLSGTFTVNNTWGQSAAVLPLPFVDDFERYWDGASISELGFAGWGASTTNVVVQGAVANSVFGGSKALSVPPGTVVSNRISTVAKKIWTDCFVMPHLGKSPFNPPTNTAAFVSYVDTNGWLVVATSNGWDVCSNLVSGGQPDRMTTSSWTRVTVCQNLTNDTVAVFINGKLVRQLMKAPGSLAVTYNSFEVGNLDGQGYLDDVTIEETFPATLTADLDRDLALDSYEVDREGSVTARNDWVGGSVYLIR